MTTQSYLYNQADTMNYTLREGCEAPVQPKLQPDDHKHPMYGQYLRYRAAMADQLVRGASFRDWLRQMEESDS